MTENPPPKIGSVPSPGTPSDEWASNTASMLNSDAGDSKLNKPALNTNVSTPGHEFPGSYPRETEAPSNHTNGDSKNGPMGASVVHAAKQYIPDQVERGIEYTGHTAAAYLPIPQAIKDTVVSYWSEGEGEVVAAATSLPSKELTGQQPLEHTSGVGALPGNASESGVALLPDERVQQSQPLMQSLPSKELAGQQPFEHTSGVGALSGTASESGVALLPDERVQQSQPIQPSVANTDSHTKPKTENGASTSHSESQYDQSKVGEALRLAAGAGAAGAAVGGLAAKSNNTTEKSPSQSQPLPQVATRKPSDVPLGDVPQVYPPPTQDAAISSIATSKDKDLPSKPTPAAEQNGYHGTSRDAASVEKKSNVAAGESRRTAEEGAGLGGAGAVGVAASGQERARTSHNNATEETKSDDVDSPKFAASQDREKNTDYLGGQDKPDPARKDRNASAPKQAAAAHTPSKSTSKSVPDKDTDYHPAKLHPPPAGTGVGESAQSDSPHASSSSPSEAQRASPTSASTTGSPKKVGFMTKVKGEAKIIAGKMSGNDSKVEQGKRVLHGQV